jgi:hypothetical protein
VGSNLLSGLENLETAFFFNNPCVSDAVINNRTKIPELIETLRERCSDSDEDPSTATTSAVTFTTTINPSCPVGNVDQRICRLEDDV